MQASWPHDNLAASAPPQLPVASYSHHHDIGIRAQQQQFQEHDYISLSAVAASPPPAPTLPQELNLEETDLRLGLGFHPKQQHKAEAAQEVDPLALSLPPASAIDAKTSLGDAASASLQVPWPNWSSTAVTGREFEVCVVTGQDYGGGARSAALPPRPSSSLAKMNGTKRAYTETVATAAARFTSTDQTPTACKNGGEAGGTGELKQQQVNMVFVASTSWVGAAPPPPSSKSPNTTAPPTWAQGSARESSSTTSTSTVFSAVPMSEPPVLASPPPVANEPPPAKDRVVGWPPIHSYRKSVKPPSNSSAVVDMFAATKLHHHHHNNNVVNADHATKAPSSEMYVKVNMDGVSVGRKLDLNAHASYQALVSALEEMFQPSSIISTAGGAPGNDDGNGNKQQQHFRLLHGSEYVLTYEDKDGDWMLVGDVPWSMFASTVKRLRIQRGTDTTGLAPPRASEKHK